MGPVKDPWLQHMDMGVSTCDAFWNVIAMMSLRRNKPVV
jgi:hypothetical protein